MTEYRSSNHSVFTVSSFLLFSVVSCPNVSAVEDEKRNLFDLSLEELLSITISVVSKENEDFLDAPGIVSVINREQIEAYGAQTVGEIIERFPGVMKNNLYTIHDSQMALRGQTSFGLDNRILVMLNGRPMRDYYTGGVNQHIYRGMSVSSIDHIEMIRGPGSVLYGSGAFVGVINIVTRKDLDDGETDIKLTVGSFDTQIAELNYSFTSNDQVSAQTSLRINHVGGWNYEYTDTGIPAFGIPSVSDSFDNGYDSFSITSTWEIGDFGVDFFYNQIESISIGADSLWPSVVDTNDRGFINVYLDKPISEHWDIRADITYNSITNDHTDVYAALDLATYNIIYEATLRGTYEKWTYLVGTSINTLNANDKINRRKVDTQWNNLYGQATFQALDNLNFVVGLQLNQTDNVDNELSPRLGLVYHFTPRVGAKLLYSEAFRSPNWTETQTFIPGVFVGNPMLEPETINTTDFQIFYRTGSDYYSVNVFYSEISNIIVQDSTANPSPTPINKGDESSYGAELEWHSEVTDSLTFEGNMSWQSTEDTFGNKNFRLLPKWQAKLGINYNYIPGIDFSAYNMYMSAIKNEDPIKTNPSSKAFNNLTLNMKVSLNKALNLSLDSQHTISLNLTNILENSPLYQPDEFLASAVNTFPWRAGRGAYLVYQSNW